MEIMILQVIFWPRLVLMHAEMQEYKFQSNPVCPSNIMITINSLLLIITFNSVFGCPDNCVCYSSVINCMFANLTMTPQSSTLMRLNGFDHDDDGKSITI